MRRFNEFVGGNQSNAMDNNTLPLYHSSSKQFTSKMRPSRLQKSANTINLRDKALPPLPLGIKRNNAVRRYDQSSDVPHDAHKYIESQMSILYKAIDSFEPSTSILPEFVESYGSPATKSAALNDSYDISPTTIPSVDAEVCWRDTGASCSSDTRRFASYIPDSVRVQLHSLNAVKKMPGYKRVPSAEIDTTLFRDPRPTYSLVEAPGGLRILKDNIPPSALADVNPPPYSEIENTQNLPSGNGYSFF